MNRDHILSILKDIENGNLSAELAAEKLRLEPYEEFSYANVDHHRGLRQGVPEVIYGAGKTAEQIRGIAEAMLRHEDENILITRISPEKRAVLEGLPVDYREIAQIAIVNPKPIEKPYGSIVVVSAGTSDMPVAEEAAVTAEVLGNRVTRIYDSGYTVVGAYRGVDAGQSSGCGCGYGRGAGQRGRRSRGLPGDRGSDKCGLRGVFPRTGGSPCDAEFLCQRRQCREY